MNKLLLSAFLFTFAQLCTAQLIIDGSNFIEPGTNLIYENAGPQWLASQNLTDIQGQEAIWTISDWQSTGTTVEHFVALDSLSVVNQLYFNNELFNPEHYSTVAMPVGPEVLDLPVPLNITDGYAFFRKDETGYYNTGTAFAIEGIPVATPNDTVERIYKFPMEYGTTDTSTLSYFINVPSLGAYGQHATRQSVVDGAGILITPYGTYDVLRVRAQRQIVDTLYIEQLGTGQTIVRPDQIDYAWISPEEEAPVLEMSVVEGAVVSARLLGDSIPMGISRLDGDKAWSVFPNPANERIQIRADNREAFERVVVYGLDGKPVLTRKNVSQSLDVSALSPGIYIIQLQAPDRPAISQKLIIIE